MNILFHIILTWSVCTIYVQILGSIRGPYKSAGRPSLLTEHKLVQVVNSRQADQPLAEVIKHFTKSAVASGRNKAFRSLYNCSLQQPDSSVCVVTEPRALKSVICVSISRKAKRVSSSTQLEDRICVPPSNSEPPFRRSLPPAKEYGAGHLPPSKAKVQNAWNNTSASPFVFSPGRNFSL
jgi:hypothetical protein